MKDEVTEFLSDWLFSEKRPVSYRTLSRETNITVDEAKKALAEYRESHAEQLEATYVVIGKSADKASVSMSIELVSAQQLPETKSRLSQVISEHVYSLSISSSDLVSLCNNEMVIPSKEIGKPLIKGPELVFLGPSAPAAGATPKRPLTAPEVKPKIEPAESSAQRSKTDVTDTGFKSGYVSRKALLANANAAKSAAKPAAKSAAKPATKSTYVSKKNLLKQPVEKVIIGDELGDDDDEELEELLSKPKTKVETEKEKKEKEQRNAKLEKLFDDDNEDDVARSEEDVNMDLDKIDTAEPEELPEETLEHQPEPEIIPDESVEEIAENPMDEGAHEDEESAGEEMETFVDEDGYTVTRPKKKTVKPRQAPPPVAPRKRQPSAQPPASKKSKPKGGNQQSSLLSFFGKR